MLSAFFHLFILSLQTSMHDSDDNKTNVDLRVQNANGKETLAASM